MSKVTQQPTPENVDLETFENPNPARDYIIRIETPEFTCLCPKTGQPDFATIKLEYVPADHCIELKALKLYYWSYRNQGAFHEAVTNTILEDLVAAMAPRYLRVTADFNVRGGVYTDVVVEHTADGWTPSDSLLNSLNHP
jgi:7-cyano-7-deazaguanine reductase